MAQIFAANPSALRTTVTYIVIGAAVGAIYFLIYLLLQRYVVTPLSCGISSSASQCARADVVAGGIATILAAVGGVAAGIRLTLARPLIVAVAVGVLTWGLATWTGGLHWLESAIWTIVLYILGYVLFGWINRYPAIIPVVIVTVVILVVERILLSL